MVRDAEIYSPWFDGRLGAQRATQGNFDADWLHDQTFALMSSRQTYHRLPRAAYRADILAELEGAIAPIHHVQDGALEAAIRAVVVRAGQAT
jgi:hypothetical protein